MSTSTIVIDNAVYSNIHPAVSNTYSLGNETHMWDRVVAANIDGAMDANGLYGTIEAPVVLNGELEADAVLTGELEGQVLIVGGSIDNIPFRLPNGTKEEPAIRFLNDPSTGLYLIDQGTLGITSSSLRLVHETASLGVGNIVPVESIHTAGNIIAEGSITSFASDKRLKRDIQPIKNAMDIVRALNGYRYTWRDDIDGMSLRGHDIGLIAQDLENAGLADECVSLAPFDRGEGGTSRSGMHYKTIQYDKLHAIWAAALREQQRVIDALVTRIERLESA